MRYIFFGTPEFAATVLEKLCGAEVVPVAVVTNPDRPSGRKKVITPPPVKRFVTQGARLKNVEILQPEHLNTIYVTRLCKIGAEMGILAAYGKIIPQEIIDVFPKGIIVVHPSLLPKYRGATPIQSALLAGEIETGTTLIVMDEKVDHGKILVNAKIQILNSDTYETLSKKLTELSANLLIEVLPKYMKGGVVPEGQDHGAATYTKKFATEDGLVDLEKDSPEMIWRKVRALNPEPGVYTFKDGKRMKILEADFQDGKLILKKIQFEGEKPKSL